MDFFHYLAIIMPYFLVLIFGVIFILFLFKIIENKREKIWNKNLKTITILNYFYTNLS